MKTIDDIGNNKKIAKEIAKLIELPEEYELKFLKNTIDRDELKQLIIDRIKELSKRHVIIKWDDGVPWVEPKSQENMEYQSYRLFYNDKRARIEELIRLGNIKKGDLDCTCTELVMGAFANCPIHNIAKLKESDYNVQK